MMKPNTLRGLAKICFWHSGKQLHDFAYHNAAPPIHRQDHREGMHCSPQRDEDEVSNTAEPAARACGECQQRLHHRSVEVEAGQIPAGHPCRGRLCAITRQDVVEEM